MFIFQFQTRLQWYSSRVHGDAASILWKITISGPFVTLYSDMEYASIGINKRYSLVYPFCVEHLHTHEENILGNFYPSELRDPHTHVTLPCQRDIVAEIFNKRTKILMFSDAPNESDTTEMKIEKQLS